MILPRPRPKENEPRSNVCHPDNRAGRRGQNQNPETNPGRGCACQTNEVATRELGHRSWSGSGAEHVRLRLLHELLPSGRTSNTRPSYSRWAIFQPNTWASAVGAVGAGRALHGP